MSAPTVLEGEVERITFHDETSLFTVARLRPDPPGGPVCVITGSFVSLHPGDRLRLWGDWQTHPQYGRQFLVDEYQVLAPETLKGIEAYLSSGRIPGLGPVTARRLVKAFGLNTLRVLWETPERLTEVEGIGPRRAARLARSLQREKALQQVLIFLQGHGVSSAYALRIYRRYGEQAVEVVRHDPYRLARDVPGIGFQTADRIARGLGFAADAPARLAAGLHYALYQASEAGHLYLPAGELVKVTTGNLLRLPDPTGVRQQLEQMAASRELVALEQPLTDTTPVFLPHWNDLEAEVAQRLQRLAQRPLLLSLLRLPSQREKALAEWEKQEGLTLAPEQRQAILRGLGEGLLLITGGPGTGKTTLLRCLVHLAEEEQLRVALAAPTGRAARRLQESTGRPARTLHRLLEFGRRSDGRGYGFRRDANHPLNVDLLIVDESSMLDLELAAACLRAIPDSARLVLVGDADQLPPVGVGQFFQDALASGVVPTVRLTHIYRQSEESGIVLNAHRINQGQMPQWGFRDFFLVNRRDTAEIARLVVDYAARRIPRVMHWGRSEALEAVQVLAPLRRGATGVDQLNQQLQQELNPPAADKPELVSGGRVLRVGDKVMQVHNDYRLRWVRPQEGQTSASLSTFHPGDPALWPWLRALWTHVRAASGASPMAGEAGEQDEDLGDTALDLADPDGDEEEEADEGEGPDRYGFEEAEDPGPADGNRQAGTAPDRLWGRAATGAEFGEGVFNGELGRILWLDPQRGRLVVGFDDGRLAWYDRDRLAALQLAYATTVHKSQGNEFAAVVFPVQFTAPALMSRHLLYTAITRAKKLCVLVGDIRALATYIRRGEAERRYTLLANRLRAGRPAGQP
ncbi:MAG: AAA family ATPase [Limnochordaceae bacterium]|nr:AAA family ATPase [Limnochordaceae bacterium]